MSREQGGAERILRERGARIPPQRVAILRALEATGSHPDADAVYRQVAREHPYISRDTVYRTLSMMEEKGIIGTVLFVVNAKRNDPHSAQQHQLICVRLRKIINFEEEKFDRLEPPSTSVEKFHVLRTTVHVEGICDECGGRRRP